MKKLVYIIALAPCVSLIAMDQPKTKKARIVTAHQEELGKVDEWLNKVKRQARKLENIQTEDTLKKLEKCIQHLIAIGYKLKTIASPDETANLENNWGQVLQSLKTGFYNLTSEAATRGSTTAWFPHSFDLLDNQENMPQAQQDLVYEVLMELLASSVEALSNCPEELDLWLDMTYTYVEKLEEVQNESTLKRLATGVNQLLATGHTLDNIGQPDMTTDQEDKWVEVMQSLKFGYRNLTSNDLYTPKTTDWIFSSLDQLSVEGKENMTPNQYSRAYEVLSELSDSIVEALGKFKTHDVVVSLNSLVNHLKPTDNE